MNTHNKRRMNSKLKTGDEVVVICGRNEGQRGKIDKLDLKNGLVTVSGVNTVKKHMRATMADQEGGIIDKVAPLPISNVMFWDEKAKAASRIGYKKEGDKKTRFAKKSGTILS